MRQLSVLRLCRPLALAGLIVLAALPGTASAQQQPGRTVTLSEFAIAVDASTAPAGTVIFNVYNVGRFNHELAVIQSDLAPDALPMVNGRVDETRVTVHRRLLLSAGTNAALTTNLPQGKYVLVCNLVRTSTTGHYSSGMTVGLTSQASGGVPLGNAQPVAVAQATATPTAAAPAAPKTGNAGLATQSGGLVLVAGILVAVVVTLGGRTLSRKA